MWKIFKIILVVIFATVLGLLAQKYNGYIVLVIANKAIKMSLVAFSLSTFIILFVALFGYRILKLITNIMTAIFSAISGYSIHRKEIKFAQIVSNLVAGDNDAIKKANIKNAPKEIKEIIIFSKLKAILNNEGISKLENAIVESAKYKNVYNFFNSYLLHSRNNNKQAYEQLKALARNNTNYYMPDVLELSTKVLLKLKNKGEIIAFIKDYGTDLKSKNVEQLFIFLLEHSKNLNEINAYKKLSAKLNLSKSIEIIFIGEYNRYGETKIANKMIQKLLSQNFYDAEILKIYLVMLNINIKKVIDKICTKQNKNFDCVLVLLELAISRNDNESFKIINDYINNNTKDYFNTYQNEKYNHILCKFFIKNGDSKQVPLNPTTLIG